MRNKKRNETNWKLVYGLFFLLKDDFIDWKLS